ncbi:MAG: hypothetical protein ACK55Z_19650, partial [bacterium]
SRWWPRSPMSWAILRRCFVPNASGTGIRQGAGSPTCGGVTVGYCSVSSPAGWRAGKRSLRGSPIV